MNITKSNKASYQNALYNEYLIRNKAIIILLIILQVIAFFLAINAGASNISPKEAILAILGLSDSKSISIVRNIRMPRIVSGIISGIGLSLAGCIMQNNLRNPLASPSILGVSNAAAFGANVAILLLGAGTIVNIGLGEIQINNPYMVTICAIIFSILSTLLIIFLSTIGHFTIYSIILAGTALNSLFSAGIIILQYFSSDTTKVAAAIFWTFGDLSRASWREIAIMGIVVFIAVVYFMSHRWDYNVLATGDETAKSLGVDVERIRFGGMVMASILTAVTVSFLGTIGFIGLVCPQITRKIVGSDNRYLIPASAIMGSLILLISDTLARVVLSPQVLPVGAVTSFIGAPLFLYFLMKGDITR